MMTYQELPQQSILRDSIIYGGGSPPPPPLYACIVKRTTNQTTGTALNPVSWEQVELDPQGMFDPASPTIVTIPIASLFVITVVFMTIGSASFDSIQIQVNGARAVDSNQASTSRFVDIQYCYLSSQGDQVRFLVDGTVSTFGVAAGTRLCVYEVDRSLRL